MQYVQGFFQTDCCPYLAPRGSCEPSLAQSMSFHFLLNLSVAAAARVELLVEELQGVHRSLRLIYDCAERLPWLNASALRRFGGAGAPMKRGTKRRASNSEMSAAGRSEPAMPMSLGFDPITDSTHRAEPWRP